VLLSDVPSPWSEAAAQFFSLKGVPFVAVRYGIRVPSNLTQRLEMFGWCNEIMGPLGLVWQVRLLLIDVSFQTAGRSGFPEPAAKYLARKYGYGANTVPTSS